VNKETVIGKAGKFNICFQDITLASHAGVVLLKEMVDQLGIPELIDQEIEVKQRQRGYPESESILALCWNLILGGEHLSDLDVLRGDPGTQQLLGLASVIAPTTAGEFLRRFGIGDIQDLLRLLRLISERVRHFQRSDTCTLDMDGSIYEQCSKSKEGSSQAYNGQVGYDPLFCFWAEEGELLLTHLRAGDRHPGSKALWFLRQVLKLVPEGKRLKLRADSAFYSWTLIDELERRRIIYAITADLTQPLKLEIEALPEASWKRYNNDPAVAITELWYAPGSHAPHRYVAKRVLLKDKKGKPYFSYHTMITNDLRLTPRQLMKWALKRCAMENQIKEHKSESGFGLEKLPTRKYFANWAWLLIGQLAFNLVAWFKRMVLPEQYHTSSIKTVRYHVLNLAGRIVKTGRQLFLVLSDHYLYKEVWQFALKQLAKLVT
jgi:Transposase DDE domain group 1